MSRTGKQEPEAKADMQFLPDSPEQIKESMKRLGPLRNQLYEACRKAIVRVNKGQQESDQPAITDDNVK